MEHISGAEAIFRCLIEEGVDTIFGYPGGAIMPVYDKLLDYEDKLSIYLPVMNREQLMQPRHMQW